MNKKREKLKLSLNKKTIVSLSDIEKSQLNGGDAITTSFSNCTNFLCCGPGCGDNPTTGDSLFCPTNLGCPSYITCP